MFPCSFSHSMYRSQSRSEWKSRPAAATASSNTLRVEVGDQWNKKTAYTINSFCPISADNNNVWIVYACKCVCLPANPCGRLRQVHVQRSQQQIDVVDPQIDTQRDCLEALNTHLTQNIWSINSLIHLKCSSLCQACAPDDFIFSQQLLCHATGRHIWHNNNLLSTNENIFIKYTFVWIVIQFILSWVIWRGFYISL